MSNILKNQNRIFTFFLVSISIFSFILVAYLILYPNNLGTKFVLHDFLIASTFIAVCLFGAIASVYPKTCGKIFSWKLIKTTNNLHSTKSNFKSHHYPCKSFLNHILKVGKNYSCATCTGLLIGAIFGITGTIVYFYGNFQINGILFLVAFGIICLSFGLFQSLIPKMEGPLPRLFAGILLVLGSYIMLISLDAAGSSTFISLFFIVISIFWVYTKIHLSQREHRKICLNCSKKLCNFSEKITYY